MADNYALTDNDAFSWVTNFLKSAASGATIEMVGITPSTETLNWRQDHPVSGLVSEFAGLAVPYVGWGTAALKIPKTAKAIAKIGDVIKKPVTTAMKKELAIFAPFEAGRVAASQVLGDNDLSSEVSSSLVNLALGAGVSGLIGGVAAAGLRDPSLPTMFPGLDIAAPAALQARHMKGILDSGSLTPDWLPRANRAYKTALKEARREELGLKEKYVAPLTNDPVSHPPLAKLDHDLNRWFRPTVKPDTKSLQVRAFSNAAEKNFPTAESWIAEADFAGLDKEAWQKGQYFRSIGFSPTKPGNMPKVIDNKITKGFEKVDDNWFMLRETDDGMFVMAKKYIGTPGKAEPTDRWLIFKTDQPGSFVPANQAWADAMVSTQKWFPGSTIEQDYGMVGNVAKGWAKEIPFRNYQTIANPKIMQMVINKLGPQADNELGHRLKETFREYFTPRIYQFTKSPRANWISQTSKVAYDYAQNVVNEIMNGVVKLNEGKNLFFGHLSNVEGPLGIPSLRPAFDSLKANAEEWNNVFANFIRAGKVTEEAIATAHGAGELSDEGANALRALLASDELTTLHTGKAEAAVGKKPTKWLPGHGGWSHTWEGDTRIPILNEKNQLVFLAGGPNKKSAQAVRDKVLAAHPEWHLGDAYTKSEMLAGMAQKYGKNVDEIIATQTLDPSWRLERAGVGGYKWHDTVPTIDEFLTDMESNLLNRWRYQANITVDDIVAPQLDRLKREDPKAYKQVVERINADAGIQGKFGRMVNKFTDEILAPVIGTDSATKIVGLTNTTLMNFQLGAMNLSYPAASLATFIQTTLPEVAMVMKGMPDHLAPYYSHFLAGGTRGPAGAMAVLHPLRIAARALGEMRKPSQDVADAVAWGINNRTLQPQMVEQYVGAAGHRVSDIYKVGSGKMPLKDFDFLDWLRATSEWLPANTERMSRTHTFIMGYMVARDLMRSKIGKPLTTQQAYEFAQQFTNKTMYMYGAADKPKVLTSPIGSGLGLFKNWMFNYMASMGQYSKEAFVRGNVAPLLWQTAGTFALGGLASTPIYVAADQFAKLFGYEDAMSLVYDEIGDEKSWINPADGIMYGMPAMLTGASLYSQVQAPGSNPVRDAASIFNSVLLDRVGAMGTAIGGAVDHWQATGAHPGSDPTVRLQMARAFMPATIQRAMSIDEDRVLSTTTGYPMVQDTSAYERMLYRLKLNPVDIDKAMAVSNKLYAKREERKAAIAQLGEAFTNAQIKGDSAEMALIMRQGMVWGLDTSSILKSAMARLYKTQNDMITRGYKPADIATYSNVLEE